MQKADELADPGSAFNLAAGDEWIFVLRSTDAAAPAAIRHWIKERVKLRRNRWGDPQLIEAGDLAKKMEAQRSRKTLRATLAHRDVLPSPKEAECKTK